MIELRPAQRTEIPALRRLWKAAFGDGDEFLDDFFKLAFAPERSLAALWDGTLAGMLYWFDCRCRAERLAYLYAVAVAEPFRGRGLCRDMMGAAHETLRAGGYGGSLLVPGDERLRRMYAKLGYRDFGGLTREPVWAGESLPLEPLTPEAYARRRETLLPPGAAAPERDGLALQQALGGLYAFPGGICAVERGEPMTIRELLPPGSPAAPGILAALGAAEGILCRPGGAEPFAMYRDLGAGEPPAAFVMDFD